MQARSAWGLCAGCGGDGWGMQKANLERTNMLLLLLLASETRPYVISQGRRFDKYEWLDDLGNHYWVKLRVSFSAQHMQPVKSITRRTRCILFCQSSTCRDGGWMWFRILDLQPGISLGSLCWLDAEEIRTDGCDRLDAAVDQVI